MALFALYVFVVLSGSAGLLGHIPLTERLVTRLHRAHAWWTDRRTPAIPPPPASRPRPVPSWAHTEPYDYEVEEAA